MSPVKPPELGLERAHLAFERLVEGDSLRRGRVHVAPAQLLVEGVVALLELILPWGKSEDNNAGCSARPIATHTSTPKFVPALMHGGGVRQVACSDRSEHETARFCTTCMPTATAAHGCGGREVAPGTVDPSVCVLAGA
jgi:hypothetical protein